MPERPLTPRVIATLVLLGGLLAALSVHRLQCADVPGPYVPFSGRTMGTTYEVKVARASLSPDAMREIGATVESTLEQVNALMSTWRDDSELSRLNAAPSGAAFPIDPDTARVLVAAHTVSERTGGAFDVTVGPLVRAWGFGPGAEPVAPDEASLAALRAHVGFDLLDIDVATPAVTKRAEEVEIDVSAIAKGFGVDAVAEALEALGETNYLVEVGGELRARGTRADGRTFRVAIEEPAEDARRIHRVIELRDVAMATSGDYRNWIEEDGVRRSHTLDPRTGRPITHALASVTVLHESAMWADAWATAINVMGPDLGYDLAVAEGLAAYLIVRTPVGVFETRATPAFAPLLGEQKEPTEGPPASN